jgi:hypothetical protein
MLLHDPKPVFVVGSARSGTELMVQILNRHPQVMIARETHYFDDLRPRLGRSATVQPDPAALELADIYFAKLRSGAYGLEGTEYEHVPPSVGAKAMAVDRGIDAVFEQHCLDQALRCGKPLQALRIWGEKTPRHVFCLTEIAKAFPGARFIFMQRDPRAVIASYRDWQNHFIDPKTASPALRKALSDEDRRVRRSFSLGIASLMWCTAQRAAQRGQAKLGVERLRIQRFEDLVTQPAREIGQICAFLGIEPCAEMQEVGRINSSYGHQRNSGIDARVATTWQARLDDREIWIIERLCAGQRATGRYEPVARRAYPFALSVEIARTGLRIPRAFLANRHRMGAPLAWVLRRLGFGG